MTTINKATLVAAGTAILGMAYTPMSKPTPNKDFVDTTYMTVKGQYCGYKSEERKKILLELKNFKKEIKNNPVEVWDVERRNMLRGWTMKEKTIVHSTKLMQEIANALI